MSTDRPAWLDDWCPTWCDGEYHDQPLVDDRRHQSAAQWWPGTVQRRRRTADGAVARFAAPAELAVIAGRQLGEHRTWVALTTDAELIELTAEDARRLHRELGTLLARLERRDSG